MYLQRYRGDLVVNISRKGIFAFYTFLPRGKIGNPLGPITDPVDSCCVISIRQPCTIRRGTETSMDVLASRAKWNDLVRYRRLLVRALGRVFA